ncbi:MAG: PQQ-like beta-propeller repeat protein, partial [Pirellulales bacterium]|nr:PQQ-like beta-propeller repeat protein [Pirellulales bacterium]
LPAGYCSPFFATIHDQPFVFVYTNIAMVCLHPETGNIDWMIEHYGRAPMSYCAVSPLVVEDKVMIVTGPGPGSICVQVNPDRSYTELWRNRRVLDSQYNTLMLHDDTVIGFTSAGQGGAELRCVDLASGELRWKYHSILRRGQGLVVGDALVLLGERGHLASIMATADGPQVLAFTEQPLMGKPCYCAPALAGSLLYLKDDQHLACFDLTGSN